MKIVNLTPHTLNFVDGTALESSGYIATIEWIDSEKEVEGLKLVSREPKISEDEIESIEQIIGDNFGIVSFPVVSAVRGTRLEGKVGSVIMKSRTEKVAFKDRFSI